MTVVILTQGLHRNRSADAVLGKLVPKWTLSSRFPPKRTTNAGLVLSQMHLCRIVACNAQVG